MEWNLMAVAAFVLFFIYDWNSIHRKNRVVQRFFGLGTAVLAVSAVGCLIQQKRNITWEVWQTAVFLAAFLLAVGLLVYALFFAIPFDETYLKESESRNACTEKMYALCRHPGVLWLAAVLGICAWYKWNIATLGYAVVVTVCNLCYVIYQDMLIFPATFQNYREYRRKTPFLIPDKESIRTCIKDYKQKGKHR